MRFAHAALTAVAHGGDPGNAVAPRIIGGLIPSFLIRVREDKRLNRQVLGQNASIISH
jgi:hypothetical protein